MHSAGRNKPFDMQSGIIFFYLFKNLSQKRIFPKNIILNRFVYFFQILINNSSGADIQMPHFAIAHLPFRQSDGLAGSLQFAMRKIIPKLVKIGSFGLGDGVVFLSSDKPQPSKISKMTFYNPYFAFLPSISSILISWLYFATRSVRESEPVLI